MISVVSTFLIRVAGLGRACNSNILRGQWLNFDASPRWLNTADLNCLKERKKKQACRECKSTTTKKNEMIWFRILQQAFPPFPAASLLPPVCLGKAWMRLAAYRLNLPPLAFLCQLTHALICVSRPFFSLPTHISKAGVVLGLIFHQLLFENNWRRGNTCLSMVCGMRFCASCSAAVHIHSFVCHRLMLAVQLVTILLQEVWPPTPTPTPFNFFLMDSVYLFVIQLSGGESVEKGWSCVYIYLFACLTLQLDFASTVTFFLSSPPPLSSSLCHSACILHVHRRLWRRVNLSGLSVICLAYMPALLSGSGEGETVHLLF